MFDEDKLLDLNKSYKFDVTVKDGANRFNGVLRLSPSSCTLHVSAERHASVSFYSPTKIECSSFKKDFILLDITLVSSSNKALSMSPDNPLGFYEYDFDIGFIICSSSSFKGLGNIDGISIDAPMMKKWVRHTNTQNEIILKHANKTLTPFEDTTEFTHLVEDKCLIQLTYQLRTFGSALTFSSGIEFPPRLGSSFKSPLPVESVRKELEDLYNLMCLFVGSDFGIDTVELKSSDSIYSSDISVYFINNNKTLEAEYPVLPLSRNLWFNDLPVPELPLEIFSEYYGLSEEDRSIYARYLRYRRMKSDEERFLGYFRLLEKLTHKSRFYVSQEKLDSLLKESKSYIKSQLGSNSKDTRDFFQRIKRANGMVYNTEKCVSLFFEKLPDDFKKSISYGKSDLKSICELRNAITHARNHDFSDRKIEEYTSLVHVLLYIALLNKIGLSLEDGCLAVHRLDGFHHIQNHSY